MSPPYRIDSFLAYMKTHPVKDGRQRNGIELTELEQVVHTRLAEHHSGVVGREDLPVVSHFWIFTFLLVGHNPRSCSFTSGSIRPDYLFTLRRRVAQIYSICDDSLSFKICGAQLRSDAKNRTAITVFLCVSRSSAGMVFMPGATAIQ